MPLLETGAALLIGSEKLKTRGSKWAISHQRQQQKKYFCSYLDTLFHLCYTVSG